MIIQIIYYLLTTGGISILAYFIFKTAISKSFDFAMAKYKNELSKDLENYKQKITLDSEKFKAELNIIAIEHNIAFNKLQEERSNVIKNTYVKLVELQKKLSVLTSLAQGPDWINDDKDKIATQALNEFKEYIVFNRIYLTKVVCEKIIDIIEQSNYVISEMSFLKFDVNNSSKIGDLSPQIRWRELNKKVNSEIDQTIKDLEDTFRKLLGDK